jgi:hypothetical protein
MTATLSFAGRHRCERAMSTRCQRALKPPEVAEVTLTPASAGQALDTGKRNSRPSASLRARAPPTPRRTFVGRRDRTGHKSAGSSVTRPARPEHSTDDERGTDDVAPRHPRAKG